MLEQFDTKSSCNLKPLWCDMEVNRVDMSCVRCKIIYIRSSEFYAQYIILLDYLWLANLMLGLQLYTIYNQRTITIVQYIFDRSRDNNNFCIRSY